ncbi:hypothetical protein [Vibrio sp. MEBiC08052]|uniref:hypothetical protein n=1 Tax=Vibrio sp. MEBiC08052 TaxID=1761910 RepID=UPI0007406FE3|nr:hypothetical protein [Vibrio sp. MEBiC08052]KUI98944.1 hypothetical protein VRK_19450 [Vibrio sp. MEBiC08052]
MNMIAVDKFLPTLRTMVSDRIVLEMKTAIVRAAITFCRKSQAIIHQRTIDLISAGETVNVVEGSDENRNHPGSIKAAKVLGIQSHGQSLLPGMDYIMTGLDAARFYKDACHVQFVSVVEPKPDTRYVPETLLSDWCDIICHGAAAILDSEKTDPESQLTPYHEREFTEGIRRAYRWRIETFPELNPSPERRRREFF